MRRKISKPSSLPGFFQLFQFGFYEGNGVGQHGDGKCLLYEMVGIDTVLTYDLASLDVFCAKNGVVHRGDLECLQCSSIPPGDRILRVPITVIMAVALAVEYTLIHRGNGFESNGIREEFSKGFTDAILLADLVDISEAALDFQPQNIFCIAEIFLRNVFSACSLVIEPSRLVIEIYDIIPPFVILVVSTGLDVDAAVQAVLFDVVRACPTVCAFKCAIKETDVFGHIWGLHVEAVVDAADKKSSYVDDRPCKKAI